jgi:hypothetical protein
MRNLLASSRVRVLAPLSPQDARGLVLVVDFGKEALGILPAVGAMPQGE